MTGLPSAFPTPCTACHAGYVQAAHLHNAARGFKFESVFSVVERKISFRIFDTVVKANRMWFSVVCTLIDNDTRHHSGQD